MGPHAGAGGEDAWQISIHPSRVGWDDINDEQTENMEHFNPPIPCGMGHFVKGIGPKKYEFQSTHPVWDGTRLLKDGETPIMVFQSTHPVWDGTIAWVLAARLQV